MRNRICLLAAAAISVWFALPAAAEYPTRPIRFIVAFPPSGGSAEWSSGVHPFLAFLLSQLMRSSFVVGTSTCSTPSL